MIIKLLKSLFAKTFILVALIPAMMTVSLELRGLLIEVWGRHYFKNTYIELIDTPSYGEETKQILEEFNSLAPGPIVSFKKLKNGRPIRITEMTESSRYWNPSAIGLAWPGFLSCEIQVRIGEDFLDYREVLIHEYLHCMGYGHSKDPLDLMYYSLMLVDKEENIRQYAIKVWRKFYE